jgi:hypothetical protein
VTLYTNGVEGKTTRFPKFDRPVPAVIVKVEANRELYEAWGHAPVDTYPRALNLEEVQAEVVVPGFLREVEQRNRDGAIRSEYEDWNTFDDSIGYFLSVDESGEVVSADATGSGVYSGPEWDTYVPVLEKIRFEPGSIGGRAIPCRVMAWVAHTFVEGGAES